MLRLTNALIIRLIYLFILLLVYGGFVRPDSKKAPLDFLDVRKSLTRLRVSDLILFDTHAFVSFYVYYRSLSNLKSARVSLASLSGQLSSSLLSDRPKALPLAAKRFLSTFSLFILSALALVYSKLALELVPLAKVFFSWGSLFFFSYLLISGFVFFLKRYAFGRFTTIISRF